MIRKGFFSIFVWLGLVGLALGETFTLKIKNMDTQQHRICVFFKPLEPGLFSHVIAWKVAAIPHDGQGEVSFEQSYAVGFSNYYSGDGITNTRQGPTSSEVGYKYIVRSDMRLDNREKISQYNTALYKIATANYARTDVEFYISSQGVPKLAAVKSVEPGLTAGFQVHTYLFVAIVEDVTESQIISTDVQSDSIQISFESSSTQTMCVFKSSQGLVVLEYGSRCPT